jgi:hypothetical protein
METRITKREGYSRRMERNLTAWKTRFEAERIAAEKVGSELKADVREKLEAAKVAGDAAFAKFGELRAAAARWAELRDEMELAWRAIGSNSEEPELADVGGDAIGPRAPAARRALPRRT